MSKNNTYQRIMKFCNDNSIIYREKLNTYSKALIIDASECNVFYYVSLSYKDNSRTSIVIHTFDIENTHGELISYDDRISYNKLIEQLGEL